MKCKLSPFAPVAIVLAMALPVAADILFDDTFTGVPDGTALGTQAGWKKQLWIYHDQ